MTTYRVTWTIDLDADRPEDAAACAQAIQRDPQSIATVFDVVELTNSGLTKSTRTQVDLCAHPECQAGANGVRLACRFAQVSSQPKEQDILRTACRIVAEGLERDARLYPDGKFPSADRFVNRAKCLRNAITASEEEV